MKNIKTYKNQKNLPHLNLSAFHDRSIQLFSRPVSLSCTLKGDKAEALQITGSHCLFKFCFHSLHIFIYFYS